MPVDFRHSKAIMSRMQSKKEAKKRPRKVTTADTQAAHKFLRNVNFDVRNSTIDKDTWRGWRIYGEDNDLDYAVTAYKHRCDSLGNLARPFYVRDAMAMSYVHFMKGEWDLSTKYYRRVIFCALPLDINLWSSVSVGNSHLHSNKIHKFIEHYDTLLCERDGRSPDKVTLKKYREMLIKLDVGIFDGFTYPIRAELRKSMGHTVWHKF